MATVDELKILVAQSCRILGMENMTREPAGHVSARIPGSESVIIKGRGPGEVALRYTQPDDLVVCDFEGKKLQGRGDLEPPGETSIHLEVLKARPDVNCVIHVHPISVVLFTVTNRELLPLVGAYDPGALGLVLDGIPRYPRSVLIQTPRLGQDLAQTLGNKSVCLMRGHGITACGPSVQDATVTAWRLNGLAELSYRAALLGSPEAISDDDIDEFRGRSGRARTAGGRGSDSTWAYLLRRSEEHLGSL